MSEAAAGPLGKNYKSVGRMNIEIKGSHAHGAATSAVSDHLPISDDRLHNIFVNAFPRSTNSIIAARHNCRERVRLHYDEACELKGRSARPACFGNVPSVVNVLLKKRKEDRDKVTAHS